ncbi:MAG: hypothetical protein PHH08_00795 [Candidatus ainarchaeum sp.]|nr:hypothetical protein [Candidatus ainarchaeum sp.]
MQVSDVVFGIILLGLLSWTMIIALNQNNLTAVVNNISARQQAVISDGKYCPGMPELALVKQSQLGMKEYSIIPAVSDSNQLVLCVYEKKQQ